MPFLNRLFSLLVSLVLVWAPLAWAEPSGVPIAVFNGDFEAGPLGWEGSGEVRSGVGRNGSAAIVLEEGYALTDSGHYLPVRAGHDYRLALWSRCEACGPDTVGVAALFRGADGKVLGTWVQGTSPVFAMDGGRSAVLARTGGDHGWRQLVVEIPAAQVPLGATSLHLYLRKDLASSNVGRAYFDDLEFAELPAGTYALKQLILNGGFEDGSINWWGKGGRASDDTAAEGRSSLKVTGGFVAQDKRPVIGGRRYRISMAIRADGVPEGSVFVQLSYRGAGVGAGWFGPENVKLGNRREPAVFVTGAGAGWQRFSTVIQTPPGARELLLYLRKKDGTPGAAYFDAVEVSLTDEPAVTPATRRREELVERLLVPEGEASPGPPATGSGVSAGKVLQLAAEGRTRYRIRVALDADVVVLHAAGELADYLQQITGATFLPINTSSDGSDGPLIVIGRDPALAGLMPKGTLPDSLGADGFSISTTGEHIVITGAGSRGTMYGVNWFLDRWLGVKWLSPDFTVVPKAPTLELTPRSEVQRPRFAYREVLSAEGQDKRYRAHNLLNGESHGPSFERSPPEIDVWDRSWRAKGGYATFWELLNKKQNGQSHPEWFAGGQIAMMNPSVRRTISEAVISRLRQHPDYRRIWFDVHDMDWGWDMDAASKSFADSHGGKPSAPRLDMMIDVANQVGMSLPDARLAFNAYHWSFSPPPDMRVPDNVLVFPMTIHVDYSSSLNSGNNVQLGRDIEGWSRIAKHVLVWDHIANFSGFLQPTPNIYPIGESIKWLATLEHVEGYFAEGSWNTPGAEFAPLRVWLISRLLWNPTLNVHALVEEFCSHYYGAAAPYLMRYIDLMHAAIRASGDVLAEKAQADLRMYDLAFIQKADVLFEAAETAVADDRPRLKHVRAARMPVDYVALVDRFALAQEAVVAGKSWSPDTDRRRGRLMETAREEHVRQYRQGGSLDELAGLIAVERQQADVPDPAQGRARVDWVDFQDLSFNRYGAARIVADESASDHAAVRLPGGSGGWSVQFKFDKLPADGAWDLYARVRVKAAANATGRAVRVGAYPPMNLVEEVGLGSIGDGAYRYVKFPGGPFHREVDHGKGVYVQGPANKDVEAVLIDRIVAVRSRDEGNR